MVVDAKVDGKLTAVAIVRIPNPIIILAPGLRGMISVDPSGFILGTKGYMINAGTTQFSNDGINKKANFKVSTLPEVQTIRVVISPKGLQAPPALAATTILIKAGIINLEFPLLTAKATVDIKRALVKLSASGERKNVIVPVAQKSGRKPRPFLKSQERKERKTSRSSKVFI